MSLFVQLHYLTVYPPSNPNRDDQGRPKSAIFGGRPRLRISSQSIKRAARLSDVMQEKLQGHMGTRTQRIGEFVKQKLIDDGAEDKEAHKKKVHKIAKQIASVFGKLDAKAEKEGHVHIRQLTFVSPDEQSFAIELAQKALAGEPLPTKKELKEKILRTADGAVDIAMFGRMLAGEAGDTSSEFNREAAVQVSHAITTHQALVEDDFYTAVDDLKDPSEDAGAGFLGDAGFGSGVYYLYACIDVDLLLENLADNRQLAAQAAEALTEALAITTPSGKRNSFGHQTRAGFIRVEKGSQQPRSLAGAFFKPIKGDNLMEESVNALTSIAEQMDAAYGNCTDECEIMDVEKGQGSIAAIKQFVNKVVTDA